MNLEQSYKSFNSISKSINEQNSSLMTDTINPNIAKLSFRVKYETKYGQLLYIIGNIEELGQWDPAKAVPMVTTKDIYPTWKITKEFTCPLGMEIYYKYLVKEGNNIYWEQLNNNRHIVIQSPGNLIIFDEKSNNISKIKTMAYYPMNNATGNLSSTTNKLNNILSNLSFNTGNNGIYNIVSSNLYIASYQSLSSYQNKSIDLSNWRLTEGENEDNNNYFNNFSSKDITYELVNGDESINNDIDPHFEILELGQNIQQEDKIIIVTTFLPFIIEKKENLNNLDNLNASQSESNINLKYAFSLFDDKLINLLLYSLKTMKYCEVYWVGMLRGLEDFPEKIQFEICENLENQKIFVVLPTKKELTNFQIYINQILYPLYNNLEIDISSHFYQNPENYYMSFLSVNKNFAEIINSCISDDISKMIFINDIDLAFVPHYLLSKNLRANISFFLHINFPNYNTLSLMHTNKDILKSLLLCNSLGFHSFYQAKNFFNAIKVYFNANYRVRYDGLFFVEYLKREIPIFIRNSNAEIDYIKNILKTVDTEENYNCNKDENKIINLLSFDTISNIYDIINKLNIFLEINKSNFLDYKYKLDIIIIKDIYTNKFLDEENEKNQKLINNNIKIINDKLGQEFNNLFKISFVDFISVKDQIKYFINADIFLFSDVKLWNGMRTLIQEFIIVQTEIISNKNINKDNEKLEIKKLKDNMKEKKIENCNKNIGLIVSQNMIVPEELKLIVKANFADLNDMKNALQNIIKKNEKEKVFILNNDYCQIKQNSSIIWIKDFLCELKKTMINNKNKIRINTPYGLEFSYFQISKNLRQLNIKKMPLLYQSSSINLFFLDLNSIFINYSYIDNIDKDINNNLNIDSNNNNNIYINNINNINNANNINNINNINSINSSFIDNNKKIINIVSNLSNDKNNIIYLVTNKSKEIFEELNLNRKNFGFVAEEGFIVKPYGEEDFKNLIDFNDNSWKNIIIQLFTNFSKKVGGGNIIQKEYSISFNYKTNENNDVYMIGEELKYLVENSIDKTKFDIELDKNNLEVKLKFYNKYHYIFDIIQKIINDKKNFNFILGLNNNDKYGEGFFEYLYSMERSFKEKNKSLNLYTAVIGKKTTKANFYFKDIVNLIEILKVFEIKI